MFYLIPAAEWCDADYSVVEKSYHGKFPWKNRFYESRKAALEAAAQFGLHPSYESYGVGRTVIAVSPPEFGGKPEGRLTARHDRARTFGVYL